VAATLVAALAAHGKALSELSGQEATVAQALLDLAA
jgi:hypothetical protein